MKRHLILLLFIIAIFGYSFAQTKQSEEVQKIVDYCKSVEELANGKTDHFKYFSLLESGQWIEHKTSEDLNETVSDGYTSALVKNGKVLMTQSLFQSGSGDWLHYVDSCYREDGSLAAARARLNTFYGHISAVREFGFNETGKEIFKTENFYDLISKKPTKPGADFIDNRVILFKKTIDLPFISLIK